MRPGTIEVCLRLAIGVPRPPVALASQFLIML